MAVWAQEEDPNANIRRLRFRRPRPRVLGVSNEDGLAEGRPIPLRAGPQGKISRSGALSLIDDHIGNT